MGVRRLYKAASPFNVSELDDVDTVQSFDVMYMAHINYDPVKLLRAGHTSWSFASVTFSPTVAAPTGVAAVATSPNTDAANSGNAYFPQTDAYCVTTIDASSGQESRASTTSSAGNDLTLKRNKNTVTWTAVTGAERYRVYKSHNGGDFGYIGSTENTSFVDDNIAADLTVGPPEGRSPFVGAGNKPSTVTFFESRLWWGRTLNNPNALYSSRSADFENMDVSVPLRADDSISVRLVSQGVNQINQLTPMDALLVFGSDGLFKIEGSNEDYLTASPPPRQRRQSGTGSSRLSPIVIDSIALYNTSNGEQVRAVGYKFEADGYSSNDMTIFSPDFFEGFSVVSWAYAEQPLSIVWAARSDGALLAFVWQAEHEVWGWTICPLAGDGKVKSVCVVRENGEDRLYAIIERTINGVTKTRRERMASAKWLGLPYENHLDCSVTRTFEEPTSVIDGLWHLEGVNVAVMADGIPLDTDVGLVVANGRVTLPEGYSCTVATVGLPFDAIVETLPLNFQTQLGASQGRKQQTGQAVVKFIRSRGVKVGVREDRLRDIKAPQLYSSPLDEASLLSGDYIFNTDPLVRLESTLILKGRISPMTVTAIYLDAEGN